MQLRLSILWFVYMLSLGVFFPYYSLYLKEAIGLNGTRVGLVMAMIPAVGLFTPPLWGHLADRTGSRRLVLATIALGVALMNCVLGFFDSFAGVLLGTAGLAIFSTVMLPMTTAVSLAALARQGGAGAFGLVRMWGTVGFLTSVLVFPRLLETIPKMELPPLPWQGLGWMFPIAAVFSVGAAVLALRLPPSGALSVKSQPGDMQRLLRHSPVRRLLVVVFAAHLCLQGPINLFPLFISHLGGDVSAIGRMWIFMLLLEIPLIGFSGSTLRRLGPRGLLSMGLLAEGIRWTTCAFSTDLNVILWMQLLHGVGVAGVLIGAPLYLEQAAPENQRSTGQALITTFGFGAAAILSISIGGWLFEHAGAGTFYGLAGIGALTLALTLHFFLPEPSRPLA